MGIMLLCLINMTQDENTPGNRDYDVETGCGNNLKRECIDKFNICLRIPAWD